MDKEIRELIENELQRHAYRIREADTEEAVFFQFGYVMGEIDRAYLDDEIASYLTSLASDMARIALNKFKAPNQGAKRR